MCMEDVRIGRETEVRYSTVAVQTTTTPLVPNDASRVALIIPVPTTSDIFFAPSGTATATNGLRQHTASIPITIDIQKHGQLCMFQWSAISPAGAQTIPVIEVLLKKG